MCNVSEDSRPSGAQPRRKVKFCRFFAIHGNCKFSDRCYYAHTEAELDLGDDVEAQQRIISECAYKAWEDSEAPGGCSYAQALAVRLAIRFEAQPQNLLPTMEKTGLPMSGGSRATVKMLLRLWDLRRSRVNGQSYHLYVAGCVTQTSAVIQRRNAPFRSLVRCCKAHRETFIKPVAERHSKGFLDLWPMVARFSVEATSGYWRTNQKLLTADCLALPMSMTCRQWTRVTDEMFET
eukprot:symbB.v1.2.001205.t1/scaffold66.1/size357995/8